MTLPGAPSLSGTTAYRYDPLGRLSLEQTTRGGGFSSAFGYDPAGNPTTFRGAADGFNAANQNGAFTFDPSGNPVVYGGLPLAFDAENHLTTTGH